MSDELNPLLMSQAPSGDAYVYRAAYHLGSLMADAMRSYEESSSEDEESDDSYDEDEDDGLGLETEKIHLPTADWLVVSVETHSFAQLQERYGQDAIWGVLQFTEQAGGAFLLMDHSTAKVLAGIPVNKRFSDDMLDTLDELVRRASEVFSQQWADIFSEAENQHGTFPEAPELSELQEIFTGLAGNTPMLSTTFRVTVPSQPMGRVVFTLPQSLLLPFADSLKVAADNTFVHTGGEDMDARLHHLGDVPTAIVAYLGATSMTVSELQGLEEEDVIVLEQDVSQPLVVEIGGGARILAKAGTSMDGSRKALQIVQLGLD